MPSPSSALLGPSSATRTGPPLAKLKVCVAGLRGIPGVMGGVETHCEELYPRICRLSPRVDIEVIARAPYTGRDRYSFAGVEVTPLAALRSKHLEAVTSTLMAIFHARFRSHADVLHLHAIGPGLLAPLARLLGLRTIVTHHGRDYQRAKWGRVARAVLSAGEWCAFIAADRVLVVSEWLAKDLARQYPRYAHKIIFAPNGAPRHGPEADELGGQAVLDRFGLKSQSFILAVGRLVPEKGFDDLLSAFARLNDGRKLVIAGAADHDDDYARSLMAHGGDNVRFIGRVDRNTLNSLYRHAERFVLPSHHEGLPLAALEAATWSTPMVLSDIPANRDLRLSSNHYFPAGDVEALSRKLMAPRSRMRVDSGEISRRFNWDDVAKDTVETYLGRLEAAQ